MTVSSSHTPQPVDDNDDDNNRDESSLAEEIIDKAQRPNVYVTPIDRQDLLLASTTSLVPIIERWR